MGNTEGNSEVSKSVNLDKNEGLKGIHLNQEEKDSFIGVLGFLQNNMNYVRNYKIVSVEKFYEIKQQTKNRIEKDDEIMNKNFLLNLQKTNNINDYVKVIDEFSTIIDKGIIV